MGGTHFQIINKLKIEYSGIITEFSQVRKKVVKKSAYEFFFFLKLRTLVNPVIAKLFLFFFANSRILKINWNIYF